MTTKTISAYTGISSAFENAIRLSQTDLLKTQMATQHTCHETFYASLL